MVRALVRFAGARTGLDARFVDETLAAVDQVEPEFLDRFDDPAAAGPAKSLLSMLQARGVDLDDLAAINAALEDGMPRFPEPAPKRRRSTVAAPADVAAAAERAPILARIDSLTGFCGDGRKLTQTGQPTLADARALVPKRSAPRTASTRRSVTRPSRRSPPRSCPSSASRSAGR